MKRLFLTALVAATSLAAAQTTSAPTSPQGQYVGGNITREYRAADLKSSYGILDIALGEIWVLTLPDDVVDVITSREGVLQFSQRGQRVVVGALASTGSYPMLVMTADSVYFFQVRLAPSRGGGVRNIIVRGDEPPAVDQQIPGFPTNPAQPRTVAPLPPAVPVSQTVTAPVAAPVAVPPQAAVPAPQISAPPAAQMAAAARPAVTPSTPVTPVNQGIPVTAPLPSRVTPAPSLPAARADVDFRAVTDGKRTVVYYRVVNTGTTAVSFDERALQLQAPGQPLTFQASRGLIVVPAGATEYGEVRLSSVPTSLSAMWQGTATGGGAGVQVVRSVRVEALGAS